VKQPRRQRGTPTGVSRPNRRRLSLRDSYSGTFTDAAVLWGLFDAKGHLFGMYGSLTEAEHDAVGPIFRPRFTVVRYRAGRRTEFTKDSRS
jgi:hypothetical protein